MTICGPNTSLPPWGTFASCKGEDDHGQDEELSSGSAVAPVVPKKGKAPVDTSCSEGVLISILLRLIDRVYFSFSETFYKVSHIYLNSITVT